LKFLFLTLLRESLPVELKASGFNLQLLLSYYSEAYSATPVWLEVELCGVCLFAGGHQNEVHSQVFAFSLLAS
jgi:hypothetical protein